MMSCFIPAAVVPSFLYNEFC
uniref:Uncharacterized protein n=1 Tax=Rhizophora mucronata TaxID=61149 RepID=A0A2P2QPM1_RHIMU